MTLTGDNSAAIRFLTWLRPDGPWTLTAIPPEGGETTTDTFKDAKAAEAWIGRFNGKQNLYFMVNSPKSALRSKASKADVESLDFLHVDVDPAKGADLNSERPKILERLRNFSPPPSAIIDSGGGYQGFWRLDESLHLGGDPVRIADAEAYNQQLEIVLGGDHCFNCDRIMRLPGTVNLPNAKKRAAGRQPRVAELVASSGMVHSLAEFTPAPKIQNNGSTAKAQVKLSGNLPSVDLENLPHTVSPRVKMLIVNGEDPDEPGSGSDRSKVVFGVVCGLIRGGCDDDTIAAILLDKDYAISGHIYDQKRPVEYVARQISRAREACIEPMLMELNDKHAVIADLGGKCRIISEVLDTSLKLPRLRLSKQSFEDFRNRYMHIRVQIGKDKDGNPKFMPAGHWWLMHSQRRQYTSLVFAPGRDVEDAYNLWQGFACDALPGKQHEPYLQHLHDNICSGNEQYYQYLIRWMARAVQRPAEQGEVAIVLRGGQGAGKGTAINGFGSLWGRHFMQVSSAKHLVGQFNGHLRDCVVLFADEAFFAGDKQHESVLKTLITEDTMMNEAKHVDAEVIPNYTHLMMSSNGDWVVPAGQDERRYFCVDVSEAHKQDKAYFAAVRKSLENGGREALLHYLMNLDLSGFEVRDVPQTEALKDQKMFSLSPEEQWWLERLMDGRILSGKSEWLETVMKEQLQNDYLRYAESQRIMRRRSPTAMGKFLNKVMPGEYPVSVQRTTDVEKYDEAGMIFTVRERAYFYDLPSLEDCRKHWDGMYGKFNWPKEEAAPEPANRDNLPLDESPY